MLQDRVDPKPFPAVERVIRQELGAAADELFAEFDREATAAASLAQASACSGAYTGLARLYRHALTFSRSNIRNRSGFASGSRPSAIAVGLLWSMKSLQWHARLHGRDV